jgi:RimJ/RimL family protein N-acetyltransferase
MSRVESLHTRREVRRGEEANWRCGLPILLGPRATLREVLPRDAVSLFPVLSTPEVTRFLAPPPTSVDAFERFIEWSRRERSAGLSVCFAITIPDRTAAIGLVQVRSRESRFATAEWGFALGASFWGTGVFIDSAKLVIAFAFNVFQARRVEARAVARNGRANGALQKLGAVQEGGPRRSPAPIVRTRQHAIR